MITRDKDTDWGALKGKIGDQWKNKDKNSDLVYSRCLTIALDRK